MGLKSKIKKYAKKIEKKAGKAIEKVVEKAPGFLGGFLGGGDKPPDQQEQPDSAPSLSDADQATQTAYQNELNKIDAGIADGTIPYGVGPGWRRKLYLEGEVGKLQKKISDASLGAPSVFKLLSSEEAPAFTETAKAEQADLEAARERFLTERLDKEEKLLQEAATKEQAEREAARTRLVAEAQANIPAILEQARSVVRPGVERELKRAGEVFGSRGLGSGGFAGSGAFQELALKGAKEVEEKALPFGLEQYTRALGLSGQLGLEAADVPAQFRRTGMERQLGRGDIFGQLGLEAAQVPSEFRRGALERGLTLRDLVEQRREERELQDSINQANTKAARIKRKGDVFSSFLGGITSIASGFGGGGSSGAR